MANESDFVLALVITWGLLWLIGLFIFWMVGAAAFRASKTARHLEGIHAGINNLAHGFEGFSNEIVSLLGRISDAQSPTKPAEAPTKPTKSAGSQTSVLELRMQVEALQSMIADLKGPNEDQGEAAPYTFRQPIASTPAGGGFLSWRNPAFIAIASALALTIAVLATLALVNL